ncbi:hypothetical protein H0H93_002891 [Arthromyces matolae]|nr:hypothetical protein H0H93_002891 [Arthromyces matolae]
MDNLRMLGKDEEKDDAEVTWGNHFFVSFFQTPDPILAEDQQRINTFSKLNNRLRGLGEQLQELKSEKEALDDLSMELELADEGEPVLYRVGESFLHMPLSRAQKRLEQDQSSLDARISTVSTSVDDCDTQMKELKVQLYAKFGSAINLDE